MGKVVKQMSLWSIPLIIVGVDLWSKYWILQYFKKPYPASPSVSLLGDYLRFTLVYNRGVTFGLFAGSNHESTPWILVGTALLAVGVLIYVYFRLKTWLLPGKPLLFGRLCLLFVIGGALGNLIDRAVRGIVVDFIDMGIGPHRWNTYNLADVFIVVGTFSLMYIGWKYERKAEASPATPINQSDAGLEEPPQA